MPVSGSKGSKSVYQNMHVVMLNQVCLSAVCSTVYIGSWQPQLPGANDSYDPQPSYVWWYMYLNHKRQWLHSIPCTEGQYKNTQNISSPWAELIVNGLVMSSRRHRTGSTLAEVKACCLAAPNHYLNQYMYWHIISKVQWYSSEGSFSHQSLKLAWKLTI